MQSKFSILSLIFTAYLISIPTVAQAGNNSIVELQGEAQIKRKGASDWKPAFVGTIINLGDILLPSEGAEVRVICGNDELEQALAGIPSGLKTICPSAKSTVPRRDDNIFIDLLRKEFAYQTLLLTENPLLSWSPVTGVNQYRVKVKAGDTVIWEETVEGTRTEYQGEPLRSKLPYDLVVESMKQDESPLYQLKMRLVHPVTAKFIKNKVTKIQGESLGEEAKALISVDLYLEERDSVASGFLFDAMIPLKKLVRDGNQTPVVYRLLGDIYLRLGRVKEAITVYQRAISLAESENNLSEIAATQVGLAHVAVSQEDFAQAKNLLEEAKKAYQSIESNTQVDLVKDWLVELKKTSPQKIEADRLNKQAILKSENSLHFEAIELYQKALSIYRNIGDLQGELRSLLNISTEYALLGEKQKAINYLQESLTISKDIDLPQEKRNFWLNLGTIYASLGKFPEAIGYLQQSLTISKDIDDYEMIGFTLKMLSNVHFALGEYSKFFDYLQQALNFYRDIGDSYGEVNTLFDLGDAFRELGAFTKAIEYYQDALAISREIYYLTGEVKAVRFLGAAYADQGDYQQAIGYLQQALNIFQNSSHPHRQGEATVLFELANIYIDQRDYQQAIDHLQQSLAIHHSVNDWHGELIVLQSLGFALEDQEDYQQAIDYLQQALAITRTRSDSRESEAIALHNLASFYIQRKDNSQANKYLQQSLEILQAIDAPFEEAEAFALFGTNFSAQGDYKKASEYLHKSLAIFKKIKHSNHERGVLATLGNLYEQQEKFELAVVFYKQSVLVSEGIRQNIRISDTELQKLYIESVADTYRRLADLLLSQDRIYEAQQVLELLKLQEIQDFTRSRSIRGELPEVVLLPQEAKIIKKYGKLVIFAAEINQCEQTNCSQLSNLHDQRDTLKREYNQDVQELETKIRQWKAQDNQILSPTSFNDIADKIIRASDLHNQEPGTVVIYPLVLKDKIWLLWAIKGKVLGKREIINVGRTQLNDEVVKLRLLLEEPNSDETELKKTSQQLYNWLIKPIEKELSSTEINHLAFSLDRGFRYIPMAVLHDGQQYLIEKYTVTTFISVEYTDTEDRLPTQLEKTSIIGVGASKFNGYDPLPHVLDEIDSIVRENRPDDPKGIYPGSQFLNKNFNFTNLRNNLKGRKILHIATHGEFVPSNQYNSFLVLGDGKKLSIPDIQVLDDYLDDVHLAVLSACETALGDSFLTDHKQEEGIEINALSFYFLQGGAKTVMASLWRVDDTSTSQLMQEFYNTLANGDTTMTKAQALRQAQLSFLDKISLDSEQTTAENTNFSHPYYWSPFILIGNGL